MVLKIKDHKWSQTTNTILLNIPLKGKSKSEVDVVFTDKYIKVNFTPYLFECFLWDSIETDSSKIIFRDGLLQFVLQKASEIEWESLDKDFEGDKNEENKMRREHLQKYEDNLKTSLKEKAEQKQEGNKYSLRQMMDLESENKEKLKTTKETETKQAMNELEEWKRKQQEAAKQELLLANSITNQQSRNQKQTIPNYSFVTISNEVPYTTPKRQELFIEEIIDEPEDKKVKENKIPLRKPCKIEVSFTPRVFPTPERESAKQQEDEWLNKQQEIRRESKLRVTADMKEEEKNPEWLKQKGNSLFQAGDYMAAISAYTMGLEINPKLYDLYSNRAACHIKMRNFFKAIDDTTAAIELLNPPVSVNLQSRVRAHLRRGAALCSLQMYKEGLSDLEHASKLDPDNQSIKEDIEKMRCI